MFEKKLINLIRDIYPNKKDILLHEPIFHNDEIQNLSNCINTGYVSSAGKYLEKFKKKVLQTTNAKYACLTSSGTAALHLSLIASNIEKDDEIITQPFTFVATINSILYTGAKPIFIDIDKDDFGLSPEKLNEFLNNNTFLNKKGLLINKRSKRVIKSVVSCDLLGSSAKQLEIKRICNKFNLIYISDSSEALGVQYKKKHAGLYADIAVLSFNGNKIITTGNGGAIFCNNKKVIQKISDLSSTSKINHKYEFFHKQIGYNYRMSNINASIGYSQIKKLEKIISNKKKINNIYKKFFYENNYEFFEVNKNIKSNFWLNLMMVNSNKRKNSIIETLLKNNIYVRPSWFPICDLQFCKSFERYKIENTYKIYQSLICLPSGIIYE